IGEKLPAAISRQHSRLLLALRAAWSPNKTHWVLCHGNEAVAHRRTEQDSHQASYVGFALRGELECLQPLLNSKPLNMMHLVAAPLRLNVIVEPRQVESARACALGQLLAHVMRNYRGHL